MAIKLILDTDIGTDVDDAWALALCLASPEIELTLAVTSAGADRENSTLARPLAVSAVRREQSTLPAFTLPLELRKSISCARASRSSTDPLDELVQMRSA